MMKDKAILLVDDEKVILKTLARDLQGEGFTVTTANSGEEAIVTLKKQHFDLIITDLIMGGLDGIQVLQEAKKIDPELPAIILTGYGDMTSAIDALRLGADDYLLKPCDVDELLFRISRALERHEMKERIKIYENILPICSVCKKIRDDSGKQPGSGDWMSVEQYFVKKTGVMMSHGYCPDCYEMEYKKIKEVSGK